MLLALQQRGHLLSGRLCDLAPLSIGRYPNHNAYDNESANCDHYEQEG